MSDLHLRPFAPHFSQIVDVLKVDLRGLLENLARIVEVRLRFARRPALLVELREVDVKTVEVRGRPTWVNRLESLAVCFCDLFKAS